MRVTKILGRTGSRGGVTQVRRCHIMPSLVHFVGVRVCELCMYTATMREHMLFCVGRRNVNLHVYGPDVDVRELCRMVV